MSTGNGHLGTLLARWREAREPQALFGPLLPPMEEALRRRYRELATLCHPDHHPAERAAATEAFQLLQRWHGVAQRQVAQGCYGAGAPLEIRSGPRLYRGAGSPLVGDLCDLLPAEEGQRRVLLKMPRHPRNNDLLEAEARHLARLRQATAGEVVAAHFPTLLDAFLLRDDVGAQRQVNVLGHEADTVTLAAILTAYPAGIEAADALWMMNRLLVALGITHAQGLVHGAVLPEHLLLRLADHNAILVDWCYSVPPGEPIRAVSPPYRAWYPPEVVARQPATPATDLYLAAQCLLRLLGGDPATGAIPAHVPRPIEAWLRGCLLPAPARRASDAWELFDQLRTIGRRLYGPPKFRPFQMP